MQRIVPPPIRPQSGRKVQIKATQVFHFTAWHVVITPSGRANCPSCPEVYKEIRVKVSYLVVMASMVMSTGVIGKAFGEAGAERVKLSAVPIQSVQIDDSFWSPKYDVWQRHDQGLPR